MNRSFRIFPAVALCALLFCGPAGGVEPNDLTDGKPAVRAAVIVCQGTIDDGLYRSIRRRTQIALNAGVKYLLYDIGTYGRFLNSADEISKYLILEVGKKARTAAYVTTEAISAGAMISVSCQDIIMRANTTIGDCAPIAIGEKLEGVEREKAESFVRAAFMRAAEANGYPAVLLKAMVSMQTEVYRVRDLASGKYGFFESDQLPTDANVYDLRNKELIVRNDELLTLTSSKAFEYGIARAEVKDLAGALAFLSQRDGVVFSGEPIVLKTNWSEEMVRWLNSPAVMGVLFMLAILGVYTEFSTPGVGLPGLAAVICFALIVGSKYLVGLANWVEVALFIAGVILLAIEMFVLPGFGVAGVLGIVFVLAGMFGMLIKNPPDQLPWPQTSVDWEVFTSGVSGLIFGFMGFVVLAWLLAKYLPTIPVANRLVLAAPKESAAVRLGGVPSSAPEPLVKVGQQGVSVTQLRPSGIARFGNERLSVVSRGELIEASRQIIIADIEGNNIVVKQVPGSKNRT